MNTEDEIKVAQDTTRADTEWHKEQIRVLRYFLKDAERSLAKSEARLELLEHPEIEKG